MYDIAEIKQQKDMLNKRCNSQQMTIANQSAEIGKYQVQIKDAKPGKCEASMQGEEIGRTKNRIGKRVKRSQK